MGCLSKDFVCSAHQVPRSDSLPCKGMEEVDFEVAHIAKLGQIVNVHLARNLFCQVQGSYALKITQTVGDDVKRLLEQQFGVALRIILSPMDWEIHLAMLPDQTSARSTLYARRILQNGESYPLGKCLIFKVNSLLFSYFVIDSLKFLNFPVSIVGEVCDEYVLACKVRFADFEQDGSLGLQFSTYKSEFPGEVIARDDPRCRGCGLVAETPYEKCEHFNLSGHHCDVYQMPF